LQRLPTAPLIAVAITVGAVAKVVFEDELQPRQGI